ncbi:MAG: Endonuclease/exonuclease/phosphatase [Klenkia sp.]|nr:Endonuclease/exonuclease/phosphatase [Klenkia sp.]
MSTPRTARPAVLGLTVAAVVAGGPVTTAGTAAAAPTDARITEIHYANTGSDTGEAVEVTAPTSADLAGLGLVLYNGNGGAPYATVPVPASDTGIAVVPTPGIQNGNPDAIALVSGGQVVEFLSYGGAFAGAGGPAGGVVTTDIRLRAAVRRRPLPGQRPQPDGPGPVAGRGRHRGNGHGHGHGHGHGGHRAALPGRPADRHRHRLRRR